MSRSANAAVAVQVAVGEPVEQLLPALEAVLARIEARPGSVNVNVDLAADLDAPVEMTLAVPVAVRATRDPHENAFALHITPQPRRHFYPRFRGMLRITPARGNSSVVALRGTYTVPLGALGQSVDATLLRGTAQASLKRFLSGVVASASTKSYALDEGIKGGAERG